MKILFSIVILFILLIFSSCDYQPTGVNFQKVDSTYKNKSIDIDFSLSMFEDTIVVNANYLTDFHYKYLGDKNKFLRAIITIDDSITVTNEKNSEVWNTYEFKNKSLIEYHKASLRVFIHSGTGSFADVVGAEALYLKKDWVLQVISLNKLNLDSLKFTPENGTLKISWTLPEGLNRLISNFTIQKSINGSSPFESTVGTVYTSNYKNNYEIYDYNYIGEKAEYLVSFNINGNSNPKYDLITTKKAEITKFRAETIKNQIQLVWNKSNYNNFGKYVIQNNRNSQDIINISNVSDTSLLLTNPSFDGNLRYSINILSQNNQSLSNSYKLNLDTTLGEKFYNFSFMRNNSKYLYFNSPNSFYLYKYDTSIDKIIDSTLFANFNNIFELSSNGKYLLRSFNYNEMMFNKDDNFDGEKINLTNILPNYSSGSTYYFDINDNGIACFSSSNKIWVYDLINKRLVSSWQHSYNDKIDISSDANYCIAKSSSDTLCVYKIEGNSAKVLKKIYGFGNYFLSSSPSQLLYYDYKSMKTVILDIPTLTEIANYNLSGQFRSYDFVNNEIAHFDYNKKELIIYDANNLNKFTKYPLNVENYFYYCNNTLFFANGFKHKLE